MSRVLASGLHRLAARPDAVSAAGVVLALGAAALLWLGATDHVQWTLLAGDERASLHCSSPPGHSCCWWAMSVP